MNLGPWYGEGDDDHRSCRRLSQCVTEFGAQGLELDGVLLAWGTDLVWEGEAWSNARAKRHARSAHVRDAFQLRVHAYRVLLTRGRARPLAAAPPMSLCARSPRPPTIASCTICSWMNRAITA